MIVWRIKTEIRTYIFINSEDINNCVKVTHPSIKHHVKTLPYKLGRPHLIHHFMP